MKLGTREKKTERRDGGLGGRDEGEGVERSDGRDVPKEREGKGYTFRAMGDIGAEGLVGLVRSEAVVASLPGRVRAWWLGKRKQFRFHRCAYSCANLAGWMNVEDGRE